MIRPRHFGYDEQTARTNVFQHEPDVSSGTVEQRAMAEFQSLVSKLIEHDIEVLVMEDTPTPPKPNAVFPNNWFATFPDGQVCLYPMATPSRRVERRPEILNGLAKRYHLATMHDLSPGEEHSQFLEGTGAIVFDHVHRKAYACISARCHETLFKSHVADLGYEPVIFHAYDQDKPIYHTNVLLGIQSTTAVLCTQAIIDPAERARVLESLRTTGHEVVDISFPQLEQYCGNVLEVRNKAGQLFLVMSASALANFTPEQISVLSHDKMLLSSDLSAIQEVGGGSARCMLAEIFLPKK